MKRVWRWLIWAVFVMVGLPFLAVELAPGDAGMAVCFVLFFGVNPIFSAVAGWFGGGRWWMPAVVAGLFLTGVWCFFDLGETAFFLYGAVYLALGWGAMAVKRMIGRR